MNKFKTILIPYSRQNDVEQYKKLPFVLGVFHSPILAAYEIRIDIEAEKKYYCDQKVINNIESIFEKE